VDSEHDFDAIWRSHGPAIWRAVLAYAGGRRDIADDAVAEAFARTIEQGATVRDPVAYLYRVAFRIASADLRSPPPSDPEDRAIIDPAPAAELLSQLRRLSPSQRAAVYLHYRADLPVLEVARIMGTSAAAVRVHLMRGRRRLAQLLDEDEVR
jgi:RNA polymerase sigma-70 factor (ECF subfamily)